MTKARLLARRLVAVFIAAVLFCAFLFPLYACGDKTEELIPAVTGTDTGNDETGDNASGDTGNTGSGDDIDSSGNSGNEQGENGNTGSGDNGNANSGSEQGENGNTGSGNNGNGNSGNEQGENGNTGNSDNTGNTGGGDNGSADGNGNSSNNNDNNTGNSDNTGNSGNNNNEQGENGSGDNGNGDSGNADETEEKEEAVALTYDFLGKNKSDAGYAEGKITVSSPRGGTYRLYWADGEGALAGYYEIAQVTAAAGGSAEHDVGYHVAIPAGATKLIAVSGADTTVAGADAAVDIPAGKRIAGAPLYTFNSYSDVHIDAQGTYKNAESNWKQALKFAANKNTDFIVTSGDTVTNAQGPVSEWEIYQKAISSSNYAGAIWESNGNHDMRCESWLPGVGLYSFVRGSGTDGTVTNYKNNRPYYSVTEGKTGDLFIFMALEDSYESGKCDEFSAAQMSWVTALLAQNYGKGKNIYLVEHAPIKGFGTCDPQYHAHLSEEYASTVQLKALLTQYPDIIWMSGHNHLDFSEGYNYSDENGTACHMIHNPSVAATTRLGTDGLDYNKPKDQILGYGSQGYYVEAYADRIVYYGADLTSEKIYPAYCYVVEGGRSSAPEGSARPAASGTGEFAGKSFSQVISAVKARLDEAYTMSSFDCYQSLKSLYIQYKTSTPADQAAVIADMEQKMAELDRVANGVDRKYIYFENKSSWSDVYCYAWNGDTGKWCKAWPGEKMYKVGRAENGDIYCVDFEKAAKFTHVIFNAGKDKEQTATAMLAEHSDNNCFYAKDGKDDKDDKGNKKLGSFSFNENGHYALCYYNGSAHNWDKIDTYFTRRRDGLYELELTAKNSEDISLCLYDNVAGSHHYRCVAASEKPTYAAGATFEYSLSDPATSRGKSITIKGLSSGAKLKLLYDGTSNKLTIIC